MPCGAEWIVCRLYATGWYVFCLYSDISTLTPPTASSTGPDNFVLKNSSVRLMVSKGRITSLLDVKLEWVSNSNTFVPIFDVHSIVGSWSLRAVLVVLSFSKIVPTIGMLGVRYYPPCSMSVAHILITQTSKSTTWRPLSHLNSPMCPLLLKALCVHPLLRKLNMARALSTWW